MIFDVPGCPRRRDRFRQRDAVEVETDFVNVVVVQVEIDGSDVIGDLGARRLSATPSKNALFFTSEYL
jgi:hypothetical protein